MDLQFLSWAGWRLINPCETEDVKRLVVALLHLVAEGNVRVEWAGDNPLFRSQNDQEEPYCTPL